MLLVAAMVGILLGCVAGCDGATCIRGYVVDQNKKPIPQAVVRLNEKRTDKRAGMSEQALTDNSGYFILLFVSPPFPMTWDFTASKESYRTHSEVLVDVYDEDDSRVVTLVPEP
jgi:hypothetical protein